MLVNNAGVMKDKKEICENGVESTYMANHFGHFYLTYLLFPIIEKSPEGRIINVSSYGHLQTK